MPVKNVNLLCPTKSLVEIFEPLGLARLIDTSIQAGGILKSGYILLILWRVLSCLVAGSECSSVSPALYTAEDLYY